MTYFPRRSGINLVHNGAMQVAQRGTSVSYSTGGYKTVDRWNHSIGVSGTHTSSVEDDGPSGTEFRKSLKILCTALESSPVYMIFEQKLEGQFLQTIKKGTSEAKPLTLSFWVKSNATGTYIANLVDNDNSRSVSQSYSISSSGTWEFKTITFPPDTTGQLNNDNGQSLTLTFWLTAGSTYSSGTLNTAWESTVQANRAVGQTNFAAANGNYWQITGVQLETGSVASPFQFKTYDEELRECQRYYYLAAQGSASAVQIPIGVGYQYGSTSVATNVSFPVTMRQTPVLDSTTGTDYYVFNRNGGSDTFNSLTLNSASSTMAQIYNASEISGTAGQAGMLLTYDSKPLAKVAFSADL